MSLLSYNEIAALIDEGIIVHAKMEHINSASIDIQLGPKILIERVSVEHFQNNDLRRVSLQKRDTLNMVEWDLEREGPYAIYPGEFILAHSVEIFHLPNTVSAEYKLKSSMARIGLDHLNAGWCDAGWHGSVLTLELKNQSRNHEILITAGDLIGQMIFFYHEEVPTGKCYASRGRYNNDKTVSGSKAKNRSINFGDVGEDQESAEFETRNPVEESTLAPRKVIDVSEVRELIEGQDPI